nr:uncharacterized protein CTRU02_10903 [Colletotrichum truncatum]KAF6786779.1 hypothetical protein CTRU02_10903 [Colletotrichum truncatum]
MGDGATYDEVVARCDDHAPFLISHFYEDSNAFDWPPTSFFQWLVERHPDIHANVLESRKKKSAGAASRDELPRETEVIDSPSATDEPPAQKSLSKRKQRNPSQDTNLASNEVDANDFATSNSQRSIRSRSRAKTKTQSRSPPPEVPAVNQISTAEAMEVDVVPQMPPLEPENGHVAGQRSHVDMILEGLEELRPELEPITKTTFSKVSSKLYYKCTIRHYPGSGEILKYYAKELLERLDKNAWGESGFWKTLEETASGPRSKLEHVTVDQISASLVRRKAKTMKNEPSASSKVIALETPPPKRVGRPAGKMSALRLVGSKGSKRRLDPTDDTPTTASRGFKTAKISHIYDSEEDQAMDDASSSGDDDDDSEPDTAESPAALKLVIRAENVPTTEPKGPNGTWVCDEDDCGFVVRNADQQEGRERIQEHIREAHYEDDESRDTRIDLAVTEGVKNHLPIEYDTPFASSYFRYICHSNDHPELSPFWESRPSGSTTE